jgi:hypothetical protein
MTSNPSPSDDDLRRIAGLLLLVADIRWAWRIANDSIKLGSSAVTPLHCLVSNISLVIHESHRHLIEVDPSLASVLAFEHANIIEKSRHRIKLFDDTSLGIDGVSKHLSDDILKAHDRRFLPARLWKGDLSISMYDDNEIGTSHVRLFNMGTSPRVLWPGGGRLLRDTWREIGGYLAALVAAFRDQLPDWNWDHGSFLDAFVPERLNDKDITRRAYYRSLYGGRLPLGIRASLDVFRCNLNIVNSLLALDSTPETEGVLFKYRLVVLYHVLRGLSDLQRSYSDDLDEDEKTRLADLAAHPTSVLLEKQESRWLRNVLVHYGVGNRIPAASLKFDQPLVGLVDFYHPALGFSGMTSLLDDHAIRVAKSLEQWAGV